MCDSLMTAIRLCPAAKHAGTRVAREISRSLSLPKTIDNNDPRATSLPCLAGKGVLAPIRSRNNKPWDKTVPMFGSAQGYWTRELPC
jgi:hypothetical protein